MSVIDNLITDRTSSDVSRWSELKSKGWSGMTESEKAEWSAGMKGAYKYTDLNRVNEAMVYLQNRLRGYGYLVDVVPPVIEDVDPGASRLPTGYQEVEYIQSSGTQYINTGYKPNSNTRLVYDCNVASSVTANNGIFGVRDTSAATSPNRFNFWIQGSGSTIRSDYFGTGKNPSQSINLLNQRIVIDKNKNVCTVAGNTLTSEAGTGQCENNLFLFCVNNAGTPNYYTNTRLYSCQIYDNGALIRDFVPAKNSDGTVGLYDLVNDAFYSNAGTGTFTAGPDVGTQPTITTRPYWAEGDIPTLSQMEQYLQNVSNIRAVLEVLQTTPPVPSDMVGLTFEEANDIERILVDVETVINRVVAGFFRSNAFTVICGNRPLPSAQSDLGRTWDDIDAEALTWDDLDDHGSSWYVIQYGVLKGTAVGIL